MVETPFALNERPQPKPTGWTCVQKGGNKSPLQSLSFCLCEAMHSHNNIIHLSVLASFCLRSLSLLSRLFCLIFLYFCLFLLFIWTEKTDWHRIKLLYTYTLSCVSKSILYTGYRPFSKRRIPLFNSCRWRVHNKGAREFKLTWITDQKYTFISSTSPYGIKYLGYLAGNLFVHIYMEKTPPPPDFFILSYFAL